MGNLIHLQTTIHRISVDITFTNCNILSRRIKSYQLGIKSEGNYYVYRVIGYALVLKITAMLCLLKSDISSKPNLWTYL